MVQLCPTKILIFGMPFATPYISDSGVRTVKRYFQKEGKSTKNNTIGYYNTTKIVLDHNIYKFWQQNQQITSYMHLVRLVTKFMSCRARHFAHGCMQCNVFRGHLHPQGAVAVISISLNLNFVVVDSSLVQNLAIFK